MSFISSFGIINDVAPDPKIFFVMNQLIRADTAAVTPNAINTLLANDVCMFSIKGNQNLNNFPRSLAIHLIFDSFISFDEILVKTLRKLAYQSIKDYVENYLYG